MREILENFMIPIETCSEKQNIDNNMYNDLELLEGYTQNKHTSFYYKLFHPRGDAGKLVMEKMAKYYTTNKQFLKDSQKLYKKCTIFTNDTALCQSTWDIWDKTKNDSNFHEKYQYIDLEQGKWLNHSGMFLLILSFYSILSPLLNILAPFIMLLIPFIILKIMKIPISAASYTKILLEQLDKHSFGQLFTRFGKVPLSQRVYLIICFGMYIYNIYQNIISCYQFYRNTYFINTYFKEMRSYIQYTKTQLKQFISLLYPLKTFKIYEKYLIEKETALDILCKTLNNIPSTRFNPLYLNSMGYVMKQFYIMNTSKSLEELMYFTFAFNGYLDNITGLSQNITQKTIYPANIVSSKKNVVKFTDAFYPIIDDKIVKNDIDLSNNIVITGPNAAGKTTILKTTILNILTTQQIGFGFYRKAKLTPFHLIHCYLNIPDTSSRDSLFQAEARRCGKILNYIKNNPQKRHFCIFDELYSGTNPYEAIASAYSYLNHLKKNTNVSFMLTTHFIKLCNLFIDKSRIENYNMQTTLKDGNPNYSYKLSLGISKIKGGICVLKNLGYPQDILIETEKIIKTL